VYHILVPAAIPPAQAIALLDSARAGGRYAFWPCDISVLDEDVAGARAPATDGRLPPGAVEVTSSYEQDEALEQD